MPDPDGDLIRESRAGSKAAFGRLVDRYYQMVYAVSFGILHEREAARDTTQDVFLKAFRQIGNFEGRSKFKTWLYRIAVNAALDQVRKRHPAVSVDPSDASENEDERPVVIPDTSQGPRDRVANHELRELIGRALASLSPEHRAVLVLREWQDLSYEEIAETLGVEMGTVMSRLFYARKKLAEKLSLLRKERV